MILSKERIFYKYYRQLPWKYHLLFTNSAEFSIIYHT